MGILRNVRSVWFHNTMQATRVFKVRIRMRYDMSRWIAHHITDEMLYNYPDDESLKQKTIYSIVEEFVKDIKDELYEVVEKHYDIAKEYGHKVGGVEYDSSTGKHEVISPGHLSKNDLDTNGNIYEPIPMHTGGPVTSVDWSANPAASVSGGGAASYIPSLLEACKGLSDKVNYPKGTKRAELNFPAETLRKVIVYLNDNEKWTREQIADWLETLDVNIQIDLGGQDDNDND